MLATTHARGNDGLRAARAARRARLDDRRARAQQVLRRRQDRRHRAVVRVDRDAPRAASTRYLAATTEVGCGTLLAPRVRSRRSRAGALIALMVVAIVTVHWKIGYFVFRPGQGIEYCLTIAIVAAVVGALGPGRWSLDHALGWWHLLEVRGPRDRGRPGRRRRGAPAARRVAAAQARGHLTPRGRHRPVGTAARHAGNM